MPQNEQFLSIFVMPYHTLWRTRVKKRARRSLSQEEVSPEPEAAVPKVTLSKPGGSFARWSGRVDQWLRCDAGLRGHKLVVLVGHPGVGKTHCARYLLQLHCGRVEECAGSDFVHATQLTSHLAKFVLDAKSKCGVLLDEFDALLGPEPYEQLGAWLAARAMLPMHPIVATCNTFHARAHKAFLEQHGALVLRVTVPKPSVEELKLLLPSLLTCRCPPSVRLGLDNVLRTAGGDVRRVQRALSGSAGDRDDSQMDFFAAVSAMSTGRGTDVQRSRYARPDVRVWLETHVLPAQILFGGARRADVESMAESADVLSLANVISGCSWPDTEVGDVLANYAGVPVQCNAPSSSMWLTQSEWSAKKGVAGLMREGEERLQARLRGLCTPGRLPVNSGLPPPGGFTPRVRPSVHPLMQALHYPWYKSK